MYAINMRVKRKHLIHTGQLSIDLSKQSIRKFYLLATTIPNTYGIGVFTPQNQLYFFQ